MFVRVKFITVQNGSLLELRQGDDSPGSVQHDPHAIHMGLPELDALLPDSGLSRGAIHEIIYEYPVLPAFFPAFFAGRVAAASAPQGTIPSSSASIIVWADPTHRFYPPAAQALGLPLDKLYLLHPNSDDDEIRLIGECLACPAVSVVVAGCSRLSQIQARRLQLAAEAGRGVGILIRPHGRVSSVYAAATRWLITPVPGERAIQRWKLQLLHGPGNCVGQSVYLEYSRETHTVHSSAQLAHRLTRPTPATAVA